MKIFYLTAHVLLISMTTVSCFLRLTPDADADYKDEVNVRIKEGGRTRRSIDGNFHPETYDFNLPVDGQNLSIHLQRNDYLITNIPTLTLRDGSFRYKGIPDKEESVFYQDVKNGAVFVVQEDKNKVKNVFGVFHVDDDEYIVQTPELSSYNQFSEGTSRFQIFKEHKQNVTFNDMMREQLSQAKFKLQPPKRKKRATGAYQIELFIVVDYSIYKYWYDRSTMGTTTEKEDDALATIRQFYAFIINGMDAMYKNIQTSSYTISIVFAGLLVAQTDSDAWWTEWVVIQGQVDSSNALSNFRTFIQGTANLPGHDHAMLFTRYDLTASGSSSNAGLAYVGVVCTDSSQSIVEDHFNFIMLTVASHELGHSLSAAHDGTGNACSSGDSYIMAPSSGAQSGSTATNPWQFSSCSTTYFTNYIDQTEANNIPCMSTLSPGYNSTALVDYANELPGQVYNADKQCQNIRGVDSFFCKDRYNNDFSTICTTMWCADPLNPGYCITSVAADGTLCGDQQWCISGVCTYDAQAPSGSSTCLYGEKEGPVFSNQDWNCSVIASDYSYNCPNVASTCCLSCAAWLTTTTSTTTTPGTGTTAVPTTPILQSTTTSPIQLSDADLQCETSKGTGSFMCRGLYNSDFTSICTTLWCANPANNTVCQSATASDGTLCGNQKWCQSGACVSSPNAPPGDETCLYGDKIGEVFTNGWTCADMVANAPNNCPNVPVTCCASCYPYLAPSSTLTPSSGLSSVPPTIGQTSSADAQCAAVMGSGSFLCRQFYNGDFTSICTTLYCSDPTSSSTCYSLSASDGTMCGNLKWCQAGACVADSNAPTGDDTCLYGDVIGPYFTNGWTCADMVANAPNNCPSFPNECCDSCKTLLSSTNMPTSTYFPSSNPTTAVATSYMQSSTHYPSSNPSSSSPTSYMQSSTNYPSSNPTTAAPTSYMQSSTNYPSSNPTTAAPTSNMQSSTYNPSSNPSTSAPTSYMQSSTNYPSSNPTTAVPTSNMQSSTNYPSSNPTTVAPTSYMQSSTNYPSSNPTTAAPTSNMQSSTNYPSNPTTAAPTSNMQSSTNYPSSTAPTSNMQSSTNYQSSNPTTAASTSNMQSSTNYPSSNMPTTTGAPTIPNPTTTGAPVSNPTTTGAPASNPTTTGAQSSNPTTTGSLASNPTTTGAPASNPTTTGAPTTTTTPYTTIAQPTGNQSLLSGNLGSGAVPQQTIHIGLTLLLPVVIVVGLLTSLVERYNI